MFQAQVRVVGVGGALEAEQLELNRARSHGMQDQGPGSQQPAGTALPPPEHGRPVVMCGGFEVWCPVV